MNKTILLSVLLGLLLPCSAIADIADDIRQAQALRLEPTDMPPKPDYARPAPAVGSIGVMDDLSFAGLPVFAAGLISRSHKEAFWQNYDNPHSQARLVNSYESRVDNYTQYFGPVMTVGLKAAGVEGRSSWGRLLASSAMSYGIMAVLVNGLKYTVKEPRPDNSTHNSWPSGHTATSFAGATILHKEYGLTRSPWYSVAGYGVATATGIMRVLNNRHWVSDIMAGAGIGILSTELGYAVGDLLFRERGLLRGNLDGLEDLAEHPSFFSIGMGVGFGSPTLDFSSAGPAVADVAGLPLSFKTSASTVVDVEGAWFFCRNIGVGGRMRLKSQPVSGLDDMADGRWLTLDSRFMTEFIGSGGLYAAFPLTDRLSLGTKALVGHSVTQSALLTASIDKEAVTTIALQPSEWDYLDITGGSATSLGTGVSLSYGYKQSFAWRVYCDMDYAHRTYVLKYNPSGLRQTVLDLDKSQLQWVLGAAFSVAF